VIELPVTDTWALPVAVTLLSIYPHAHYLGKEMVVAATPPGGVTRTLIHIKQWSFHWQQAYRFVTPVALPRGTVLALRYTYDNSAQNAENPHHPPQRVRAGPKSTDEMADLGLQMLTGSRDEAQMLMQSFAERDTRANIEMAEQRVRESPDNADYRAALGGTYVEVGRFAHIVAESAVPTLLIDSIWRLDLIANPPVLTSPIAESAEPTPAPATPAAAAEPAAPEAMKKRRMWRGQWVD